MISITSCNQVAINHQFHRRVGETKFRIKYSEKEKCFIFVYKGILCKIALSHRKLKKKDFLKFGKKNIKEPAIFQTKKL